MYTAVHDAFYNSIQPPVLVSKPEAVRPSIEAGTDVQQPSEPTPGVPNAFPEKIQHSTAPPRYPQRAALAVRKRIAFPPAIWRAEAEPSDGAVGQATD